MKIVLCRLGTQIQLGMLYMGLQLLVQIGFIVNQKRRQQERGMDWVDTKL